MASRDRSEITRQLAHVPLFEGVPDETLARIVSRADAKQLESGGFFFSEGGRPAALSIEPLARVGLLRSDLAGAAGRCSTAAQVGSAARVNHD